MQHQYRMGTQADLSSIVSFDEFGGDRQHEVAAGTLFVAVMDEEVVGYASYSPRGLLGQPFLGYLCVRKDHRRHGIATSLVKHVQSVAKGRVLISSTEDWCVETQRIFERLGWRKAGHLSGINKDGSTEVFFTIAIDA